jgi:putative transposase
LEELARYIDRQEQHHRTQTFQEEYRHLLQKYHVECDERYVWD